jgi:hypothetical protein
MDPHERFHRRNLRDTLVSQGVLNPEQAEELAAAAQEGHEAFGSIVVDAGYLSSWDLAKTLAASYQMPVLPLVGYEFDRKLLEGLSPTILHQYRVLPIGRFGRAWSFAVVEPPSRELVETLRSACGNSIFFFAAEVTDVLRLLKEHVKVVDAAKDTAWQSIFDSGEQAVHGQASAAKEAS